MRGLVLSEVGEIVVRSDLPEPVIIDPHDAIVRVEAAGLCGSDLHPYMGREPVRFGVVQGHEAVGEVVEAGPRAGVSPGARVVVPFTTSCGACRPCTSGLSARCIRGVLFGFGSATDLEQPALAGMQAEYVRVPLAAGTVVPAPAISSSAGVLLADNLPTGWEAVERAGVSAGDSVAIVGLGSVGLCAVLAARVAGADRVTGLDPEPTRRAAAEALGAETSEMPEQHFGMFDCVVEAAGPVEAQRVAVELVRPGGTVSVISVQTADRFGVTPAEAYDRNLTMCFGRASVRSVLDRLVSMIEAGSLTVPDDVIVTHPSVPLDDGPQTYEMFAGREPGLIKAVFVP